jgi:hypothetical protein
MFAVHPSIPRAGLGRQDGGSMNAGDATFLPFLGRLGVLFDQLPHGVWHKWPQAAQRIASVLVTRARFGRLMPSGLFPPFAMSDPRIMDELEKLEDRVSRRCVQKGLRQLEDIGVIRRFRQGGTRFIAFLVGFAKPKRAHQPGRKSDGARNPAAPSASAPDVHPAGKPVDPPPDPDPGPALSPEERSAWFRNLTGREASPQPAEAAPQLEAARRPGLFAFRTTAAPTLADPEKVRKAEESKERQLAAIAARKQARQVPTPDPSTSPARPDETARE